MRLLQITTALYAGGIQKHMLELSHSLKEKGHDVFLAGEPGTWQDRTTEFEFLPLDLLAVSTHFDENQSIFSRIAQAFKCAYKLRKFLKSKQIELIHAHESAPAIVARIASLGMGIPIAVTYHGSAPERVKSFGYICRLIAANLVITPSHRCAQELNEQAGLAKEKINVIALGVEHPPSIADKKVEQHRKKLLGADRKLLVVMIARLDYQKGIDILIKVIQQILQVRQDIQFVVVGEGPLREDVKEWAKEADVEAFLTFEGVSSEPYLYLKAADIFLLTSRWEALPITIAEAFQVGLPVIATDTGGVKELVAPTVGYVLPVGDTKALSASILNLCNDDKLRSKMSEEAIKLSQEDRFSIPHVHDIFLHTYAKLIKDSNP